MQFKHVTIDSDIENLAKGYTYHIFYPENENQPEPIDDADTFLGTDYATSVMCKDKEELDLLLNEITQEYYQTLKSEYDFNGIHAVEINGIFLVSLEVDYLEEEKYNEFLNKFIVIGSQSDDVCLLDLIKYRKSVKDGVFEDRDFEALNDFFEEEFGELEEEYLKNNQEEEFNEIEVSIDFYIRVLEYCGEGRQKEKLDYIIDQVEDLLFLYEEK